MTVLGIVLLTLLVGTLLGAPLAVLVSRTRSWGVLTADSVLAGFVVIGLVPTLIGWLGPAGAVLAAAAWIAAVVAVIVRRPALPPRSRIDRATGVLLVAGAVVGVVALAQRLHVVNFLPWVGDMGAYVNWGNQFARTGELTASWPPVLPGFFGASSWIFGTEWTTAPLAVSGLVLLVAVARVLHAVRVDRWIVLAAVTVLALHAHAVWYSAFPASETLNAPYFTIWLLTILGALRAVRPAPWIAASGVLMLVLGLLRGTGPMLLLPLGVAALAALVLRDWRHLAPRLWALLAATVAGALLAYWYGITEIRFYYVEYQLSGILPGTLFAAIEPFTRPGPWAIAALVLAELVVVAIAVLAARLPRRPRPRSVGPRIVLIGAAAVFTSGVAATAVVGAATWDILLRMGPWLGLGVVVALVLASGPRVPRRVAMLTLIAGSTVVLFYALHTTRTHLAHSFYIYWDRYVVSEILPAALVLSALAVELIRRALLARPSAAPLRTPRVLAPLAVVVMAGLVLPQVPALALVARDTFFAGAYRFQMALESHVDDPATPIVWAATDDRQVPGFFFPNTFMAFARPMIYTSGLEVVRVSERATDFSPDEVLDATAVAEALGCSTTGEVLVYELRNGGASLDDRVDADGIAIDLVATEEGRLSILSQPPTAGWTGAEFTVDVWRVSGSSAAACVR